ncbi:helix-turn-helix domain-containing protein [Halobacteriovorax sp. GFR7]|uniref:helix-turn-helix domain-containing protein n=1 Tax=unclassified Halobacteriovorax TaxID=2639665 RepID=UPI003D982038
MRNDSVLLKLIREEKELSQRKVADSLKVSCSYISQVENGHKPLPKFDVLIDWLRVLKIKPKYFEALLKEREKELEAIIDEKWDTLENFLHHEEYISSLDKDGFAPAPYNIENEAFELNFVKASLAKKQKNIEEELKYSEYSDWVMEDVDKKRSELRSKLKSREQLLKRGSLRKYILKKYGHDILWRIHSLNEDLLLVYPQFQDSYNKRHYYKYEWDSHLGKRVRAYYTRWEIESANKRILFKSRKNDNTLSYFYIYFLSKILRSNNSDSNRKRPKPFWEDILIILQYLIQKKVYKRTDNSLSATNLFERIFRSEYGFTIQQLKTMSDRAEKLVKNQDVNTFNQLRGLMKSID